MEERRLFTVQYQCIVHNETGIFSLYCTKAKLETVGIKLWAETKANFILNLQTLEMKALHSANGAKWCLLATVMRCALTSGQLF